MSKKNGDNLRMEEVLAAAEAIAGGALIVPAAVAEEMAARCLACMDAWWENDRECRVRAATAVKQLSYSYSGVLTNLQERARAYWTVQREIGDASPYSPNAIEVLGDAPANSETHALLLDLEMRSGSMADSDVQGALARIVARLCS